jgi:DNA-binding NarL/FixJ family response regulator
VDDQELFIESLGALLSTATDQVAVLWAARSGEEALEAVRRDPPEVLLLDYFFRGSPLDGGETCRLLQAEHPGVRVLMLSVSTEAAVIRDSLQKGALGYISKEIGKNELLQAISAVAKGHFFFDQSTLQTLVQALLQPHQKPGKPPLTPRELEVALLYAKGSSVRDIGQGLFISEDTVESHIKNLRAKSGATNRYEVGEFLKQHGLWGESEMVRK